MTSISIKDTQECCDRYKPITFCCGGFLGLMLIIFLSTCWGMIQPYEYGLLRNGITGTVDLDNVYDSGRSYIGWGHEFVTFPARRQTISITVQARTGQASGNDESSGGQPVTLDVAFQYKFEKENIKRVYSSFNLAWETSYARFASQAITNVAQTYSPPAFWQTRAAVEAAFKVAVNASLIQNGFVAIEELQLVSVLFRPAYENTITNIQLQEQLGVTRRFQLEVTAVEQSIALLQSQTDAQVNLIGAEGSRVSAVLISQANSDALLREQTAKAEMYSMLRQHLNWTEPQFLDYIRMKALNNQPTQSNVKVATDAIGEMGSTL